MLLPDNVTVLHALVRLWRHLSRKRQRQYFVLLGLSIISSCSEVISLAAIVPFLSALAAPDRVMAHPYVAVVARAMAITTTSELLIALTAMFALAALAAGAVRLALLWATVRLAFATGADLGIEIYRRTLYQPYQVHVLRNSSEVISGIRIKAGSVVYGIILPFLTLISSMILVATITFALTLLDPVIAIASFIGFGSVYAFITWLAQRKLARNGDVIARGETQVLKALQEGLGGVRDVLLDGSQAAYCEIYQVTDQKLRKAQADNIFISQGPKHAIEAIGMVLIAILAYGLVEKGGIGVALPMLGALAVGAQRILPSMQQIYWSWASMAGHQASFVDVLGLLAQPMPANVNAELPPRLPFKENIRLCNVKFRYQQDAPLILKGLSLSIRKGARVGFMGSTGSGKSTLLDLIMGLIEPIEGQFSVDGQLINADNLQSWRRNIGHVPQAIFLADATIAENIALGVPTQEIDLQRVRTAAQKAKIAEFIEAGVDGYDAMVGERGIQLSGGQRQRIGIARALYKEADVLVFDEATSALDDVTERAVIESIVRLDPELTVLIIAHRLSTVRQCDTIFELEDGNLVARHTTASGSESSFDARVRGRSNDS